MKKFVIYNKVFNYKLEVVYIKDEKKFSKYCYNMGIGDSIKNINNVYSGFFIEHKNKNYIILNTLDISLISHELVHVIFNLLTKTMIPIELNNDEVFAYLMGYYIREILLKFKLEELGI